MSFTAGASAQDATEAPAMASGPSAAPTVASVTAMVSDREAEEGQVDVRQLHPSVRFYRGMWRLTQLIITATDDKDDWDHQEEGTTTGSKHVNRPPSDTEATSHHSASLSVVALHQRLLPPAPVNGLGEIAEESYAAQLATSDGLELLRVNWHLLLPLLFPSSYCAGGNSADAIAVSTDKVNSKGNAPVLAKTKGEAEGGDAAPESLSSADELYCCVRRPLSEEDLTVVQEPGHMDRIYYSYIVLLRFFGWRVHDEERGLLDRTRAWAERYALLQLHRTDAKPTEETKAPPATLLPPPTYAAFDFYRDGLPRVLSGLLDVGFLRLAVRLVEFVMEEMKCDRLLFLLPLVEDTLLPMVVEHEHVEDSHKARLRKQLYRLTHSDSD